MSNTPKTLSGHQCLQPLSPELRHTVASWVEKLIGASPEAQPGHIMDQLDAILCGNGEILQALPVSQREHLRLWESSLYEEDLLDLVETGFRFRSPQKGHPKATPAQIEIILETQSEVQLDVTRFLSQLTSWEADALVKGLCAISEIQRQTGDRHFPIKHLRRAIRSYIAAGKHRES